jgi:hypothetical protein
MIDFAERQLFSVEKKMTSFRSIAPADIYGYTCERPCARIQMNHEMIFKCVYNQKKSQAKLD